MVDGERGPQNRREAETRFEWRDHRLEHEHLIVPWVVKNPSSLKFASVRRCCCLDYRYHRHPKRRKMNKQAEGK